MPLVNLQDLVIVGPGSEWFWVMAELLVLVLTGIAIFRQLRAQRSASLYEQLTEMNREFAEPWMVRNKLALMLEIQGRDPEAGFPYGSDEIADFFQRVGYLVSKKHLGAEDVWNDSRSIIAFYWSVLGPYIEHDREANDDPTFYNWFEWLELEMRRIDMKRTGRTAAFDPATRADQIARRIGVFRSKVLRETSEWPASVSGEAPPARRQRRPANGD